MLTHSLTRYFYSPNKYFKSKQFLKELTKLFATKNVWTFHEHKYFVNSQQIAATAKLHAQPTTLIPPSLWLAEVRLGPSGVVLPNRPANELLRTKPPDDGVLLLGIPRSGAASKVHNLHDVMNMFKLRAHDNVLKDLKIRRKLR